MPTKSELVAENSALMRTIAQKDKLINNQRSTINLVKVKERKTKKDSRFWRLFSFVLFSIVIALILAFFKLYY